MMDQEIEIISANTRKEKIRNFFVNNKKKIATLVFIIILTVFGYFYYEEFKLKKIENLANQYNKVIIKYELGQKENIKKELKEIIYLKDSTYSVLAFYFLLDNNLIDTNEETNKYFDILINEIGLDEENKNLIIFKKGLFNSDFASENEMLDILNSVIKSESIWKPHALYLMAEFYLSKNEKQKAKEFFNQLVNLENVNDKIKIEVQKRLRADFSE
tara:strand:- start:2281 stop:2928 length:648 start_codon:yes stop_codon:yes gene_type:complete